MPFHFIEANENNVTTVSFSKVNGTILIQGCVPVCYEVPPTNNALLLH
jgi:hypothetical protein